MTVGSGDTVGLRGRSEQGIWRPGRWLTVALMITATGITACGADGADGADGGTTGTSGGTLAPSAATSVTTPSEGDSEPILIKTRLKMFVGKVLGGSVLGDSAMCPGGTVRHEDGSPEIGFPAINVFECRDGQLKIGFGPGADQMNDLVQTSDWKILEGSGRFAGISGDGQMIVQWEGATSPKGQETFMGMVVVP